MSLGVGCNESATVNKSKDDWEVVAADRWRTSFRTLPMSYPTKPDPTTKKWHRPCHRSFLFYNPHRKRVSDSPNNQEESFNEAEEHGFKLNGDLPGVQAALDSVAVYEEAVGFHYEQFPSLGLNLSNPIDLTVIVDEKQLLVNKKRWNEILEELMNGPAFDSDESLESSFVGSISSGGLHRSMSTVSSVDFTFSEGSIDSAGMPSTPRPKSSFNNIQIKETSPRSMDFRLQPLSPTRSLNAAASSFVPASVSLDEYSARSPSPSSKTKRTPFSEFPFNTFTFPTLNSHTPAALKVRKDDGEPQFNSPSAPTSDLLPPFFQDAPQRTRTRKSRTREIVDRLRSQIHPGDNSSQDVMSSLNISERAGEGASSPSAPNEDDDGWIDSSAPSLISPSKSKRARELLLALARRRTDSLTSEAVKEIMEAHSSPDSMDSREISFSPSPSPSPPLVTPMDDGWKASDTIPVAEPSKKAKRPSVSYPKDSFQTSTTNKKKGTSNTSTRTSAPSSTHSHAHRTTQAHHPHHPVQPQHYASQAPYAPASHLPSAAYPSHPMAAPSQTHVPYFFPQYPAVVTSVPYGTYLQPHYPMGVGIGIPMHSGSAPLVNPVMVPNGVQYAPMPAPQMVPVPLQTVLRLGTVPTKGVQATSPNISLHSSSTTTSSYRQPPKHAASLW